MTKKRFAKIIAWAGGAVTTLAAGGQFGKYGQFAAMIGTALTAWAIHQATETSAERPNGGKS